jgi:uncharacterized protein (TIGR02466 family)
MNEKDQPRKKDGLRVLFPTLIYVAWYPDYEAVKQRLVEFNLRLREEDQAGKQLSKEKYASGFTSYFSRNDLYRHEALKDLVDFLYRCADAYATQHHWDVQNYQPVINTLWGNINSRYSFHAEHLHPYSHISGVFYVDIPPGSPAISFKDPRAARWMMPPAADGTRPENTFHASVPPESGKLLLFPSWIEHGVPQNLEEVERISMSFNFEMRPRSRR